MHRGQTQLSQKPKTKFGIFLSFLESALNFPRLEKKSRLYSLNIFEVIASEKCDYLYAKKAPVSGHRLGVKAFTGLKHC